MEVRELINKYDMINRYNLQNYYNKQLSIEENSEEWNSILDVASEVVSYFVEHDKTYWTEEKCWTKKECLFVDGHVIKFTDIGVQLYNNIEDEVMSHFNITVKGGNE